jgi:GNAT superfamily N-acetyltransferase
MSGELKQLIPQLVITPRGGAQEQDRIDIDLPHARVGSVRCLFQGEKVIVYSIRVFPEFEGNGFGRRTIEMLKGRFAMVVADRVRFSARGFWEKLGFQECPDHNWVYVRAQGSIAPTAHA